MIINSPHKTLYIKLGDNNYAKLKDLTLSNFSMDMGELEHTDISGKVSVFPISTTNTITLEFITNTNNTKMVQVPSYIPEEQHEIWLKKKYEK